MSSPLSEFLYPNSVAIVGASKDPTKRGFKAIQTLLTEKYPGMIFPIHPREPEILGLTAYPDVNTVPNRIDLALVCTPAHTVPDVIKSCGEKGIKGAVILAGGFSESGEAGQQLEQATVAMARQFGVRLVGPNTSGMFNTHKSCNLVGFSELKKGPIGILSQSGNMALALAIDGQINDHIGFSTYIGVGNEAEIEFDEYLDYFGDDENTQALAVYAEGFKQGRNFLAAARRVTQKIPVVLYKSGKTAAGQQAAQSHTGALAGNHAVSLGVMRQAGITVVSRTDHILPLAEALALLPPMQSKRVAILADGGGHATIAADALTERGMILPPLGEETRVKLAAKLPPAAALANPVDVAGGTDSNPEVFADCARAILQDENVDALLIVGLFGGYKLRFSATLELLENQTAARLGNLVSEFGKPVLLQSIYEPMRTEALVTLREFGVPVHYSIETAVQCLIALAEYGAAKRRNAQTKPAPADEPAPEALAIVQTCRQQRRDSLLEHEAKQLLNVYGIAVPPSVLVSTPSELSQVYGQFGDMPLAMKVVSPDILHKSDAGGVQLNVCGESAMQSAYQDIMDNAYRYQARADIRGVLVSPMMPKGVEIIIGVTRDPQFGPVMMVGLGGIFVEVLKDVAFRTLPLSAADAAEMLEEIKAKAILEGVRGAPPADKPALI
ncbi:MAG: acetate--CoA ligase family protein, partial [Candidatus Competibacteraceae bacterium]|nr:acetate--CoA ligase family protein [Candidatus Competibacteraceae bacterium]